MKTDPAMAGENYVVEPPEPQWSQWGESCLTRALRVWWQLRLLQEFALVDPKRWSNQNEQ